MFERGREESKEVVFKGNRLEVRKSMEDIRQKL